MCALSGPSRIAASTSKESETLLKYEWKARWPIRGTVGLTAGLGTDQTFELILTYDLPMAEHPNLEPP
jgi:hypothetical protein